MKNFALLFVLLIACHTNIGYGQIYSDKEIEKFNKGGLIKSVTERTYDVEEKEKFGELVVERKFEMEFFIGFNKKSQVVENSRLIPLINEDSKTLYILNEVGYEIGHISYRNGERSEYSYDIDINGKILQEYKIDSDGNKIKSGNPRIRDERGNQIERNMGDWGTYKNVYDSKNRELEQNLYKDGKLDSKTKYEYYPDDKLHVSNEYFSDGSLKERHIYTYHQSGKKRDDKVYDSNKILKQIIEYNWMGDEIKTINYSNRKPVFEEKHDITYEDDVNGNWIKKTKVTKSTSTYENGDIEVTERILEYY